MSPRVLLATGLLALATPGCSREGSAQMPAMPPPIVTVAKPVEREVTDYREFTGRTVAIDSVVVRARVTGYVQRVHFKEGADVKAGDLLYEIDPRPYQATLTQAEGNVAAAEAKLVRLVADLERARKLLADRVVSQEDFDRAASEQAETAATLLSLRAAVDGAKLDLEFTRITAPITGRTGKNELDAGNLVLADVTALTSIVSVDPIHAEFDVDERSVLLYRSRVHAHQVDSARDSDVPIQVGLSDEEGYPHAGLIDFVDNQLDPTSGTIRARAVIANPDGVLSPGLFVRIRVPFSQPHEARLVEERALGADQLGWFVYVVDAEGKAQHRTVELGEREDGHVVVTKGLAAGERVIVNGLQRARPGLTVDAREPNEGEKGEQPMAAGAAKH